MPTSAKTKRAKRNYAGFGVIMSHLQDPEYVSNYMPYALDGEELVATKFSQAIYDVRGGFDLKGIVQDFVVNVPDQIRIDGLMCASVFIIPYSSVLSLPNGYIANRIDSDQQSAVSLAVFNSIVRVTAGTESVPIGVAYLIAAHFSDKEVEVSRAFERSLAYTNDVLTALKITRHDHQLANLTRQTLPSFLDYYQIDLTAPVIDEPGRMKLSDHDLVDIWAKRLPETAGPLQEFAHLCEGLLFRPEIRYLLDLMADCVTNFCLGRYESVILDSDRFAELSFRLCFVRNSALREHDVKRIKRIYHPDPEEVTILSLLMDALDLPKTDLFRQWNGKSRKIRNRIAHDLDFSIANERTAMEALKYNMNVVDFIAKAHQQNDWDILLLSRGAALVYGLFEAPGPRQSGRPK